MRFQKQMVSPGGCSTRSKVNSRKIYIKKKGCFELFANREFIEHENINNNIYPFAHIMELIKILVMSHD